MVLIDDLLKKWENNIGNQNYDLKQDLPPVWFAKSCDLDTHIDTIMHLIFLGVAQKVGMTIKQILTIHSKYSVFHHYNKIFGDVRMMNLDWCKLLPFGSTSKSFASWVSENYLAYVRVIKCIYGALENQIQDEELVDSIMFLVCIWHGTVCRIMQKSINDNHIDDTERQIKMFLSGLKDVENCYSLNAKKSMFETTANLTGLLNLPDYMRRYGPLRLYWEGGFMGEGIIKYIKPCMPQGTYKPTFALNAVKKIYKESFFRQ